MAQVIALTRQLEERWQFDALRALVVCGCALALIVADRVLPF